MHLREAFWTMISRPVDGIMYHGWQALVPTGSTVAIATRTPIPRKNSAGCIAMFWKARSHAAAGGDRKSDVAYLDSFTSQMFARRGTYGYLGDETYLTLLHAQLQPQVVFEDQVLAGGLDSFKLLVLADCDVLSASVVSRIQAFQKRGGLVIGDENLAPAIQPNVHLPRFVRAKKGASDHDAILRNAAGSVPRLEMRTTGSPNPVIRRSSPRVRTAGRSNYVFVINDRREAGTYVGQHGMVLEKRSSPRSHGFTSSRKWPCI
jgi:hypothetical protein